MRIVASQDGTIITQTSGTHISAPGGQTGPTYTLNAGQCIELEALLTNNGCHIYADKPIGVCTYLTGLSYNGFGISDPAQSWLPAIEQTVTEALVAPFVPTGTYINTHYALVITNTDTKYDTKVSVNGAPPVDLSGGSWTDNPTAGMSFYTMPMANVSNISYNFTNDEGLIILCYGVGNVESYYFLGFSATRNLKASFYANDIYHTELPDHFICEPEIHFRAEITGLNPLPGSLKWYIDGEEETDAQDLLEWSKTFLPGEYEIKMWVLFTDNDTMAIITTLKICNLEAAFYANDVHHSALPDTTFCSEYVNFFAEIEGLNSAEGSLKWFIGGVEEESARDELKWSKEFATGVYEIKMEVLFDNNETATITSTLKVEVFWIKIRNVRY